MTNEGNRTTQSDPTSGGFAVAITAAEYHDDEIAVTPSLSKSIIHTLLTHSPAHAWTSHPRLNPNFQRVEEQKFDVGTACHDLFLEGVDRLELITADNWRTKAAQEARDIARADGRIPLLVKDAQQVQAMCQAIRRQIDERDIQPPLFADGRPELTLVWEDRDVLCRARLDWLRDDLTACDDLKSTSRSANPEGWCRNTLYNIGADLQAAFYLRGLKAVTGQRPAFRFVVVETTPPYALSVIQLTPAVLALADEKIDYALDLWRGCLERDVWPAYTTQVAWAELPGWMEAQWLERRVREEVTA